MAEDVFDYWFPWYPARFERKTLHLTLIQRAIYRELIDFYMKTRSALPDNDVALARIAGISPEEFGIHASVIRAFFKVKKEGKNGVLFHPTCEGLLRDQQERAEIRKNRAKKGGKAKAKKDKETNGNYASSKSQADRKHAKHLLNSATVQDSTVKESTEKKKDIPNTHDSLTAARGPEKSPEELACVFSEFWDARPGRGKHADPEAPARAEFARLLESGVEPERLVAAMRRYAAHSRESKIAGERYAKSAVRFLSEGFWRGYDGADVPTASVSLEPLAAWLQPLLRHATEIDVRCWFKDVMLEDGTLYTPSKFVAENLRNRFGKAIAAAFGKGVEIVVGMKKQQEGKPA